MTVIFHLGVERLVQEMLEQEVTDYLGREHYQRQQAEQEHHSLRQRCLAHKTRNVTDKVPDSARAEVKVAVQAAYYAPNQEVARMIAADVLETYQALYPSAMRSFQDDWEACIAYLHCPHGHHPYLPQGKCKRIRTTNLLERSFLEERRRTKVIPRFFTEKSCLKLVSATLWRASQRWQDIRMADIERQQLRLLRRERGLLHDQQDTFQPKARSIAA
jgi:putative transposase